MKERISKLIPRDFLACLAIPLYLVILFWPVMAAPFLRQGHWSFKWYINETLREIYVLILYVSFVFCAITSSTMRPSRYCSKDIEDSASNRRGIISCFVNFFPYYIIWIPWLFVGEAIVTFLGTDWHR